MESWGTRSPLQPRMFSSDAGVYLLICHHIFWRTEAAGVRLSVKFIFLFLKSRFFMEKTFVKKT